MWLIDWLIQAQKVNNYLNHAHTHIHKREAHGHVTSPHRYAHDLTLRRASHIQIRKFVFGNMITLVSAEEYDDGQVRKNCSLNTIINNLRRSCAFIASAHSLSLSLFLLSGLRTVRFHAILGCIREAGTREEEERKILDAHALCVWRIKNEEWREFTFVKSLSKHWLLVCCFGYNVLFGSCTIVVHDDASA